MRHDACMETSGGTNSLSAALDEVQSQLESMSPGEIVCQEDLEWSIGPVFVQVNVRSGIPLVVDMEASQGLVRRTLRRSVNLNQDPTA